MLTCEAYAAVIRLPPEAVTVTQVFELLAQQAGKRISAVGLF
jgi:hypothetical protein